MAEVETAAGNEMIGFIGLGRMGLPMATRLASAGHDVRAYDASPAARERAAAQGLAVVESLADALEAEVVVLMLPDSSVVRHVVEDPQFALRAGALLVDMGSSEPMESRALGALLGTKGIRMIDAPVSGGVRGAEEGRLTIMVGGIHADVEMARPLLELMGTVVHVGSLGAGDAVKALNNLLSATHLWVTSEAMLVGERFGVDPDVLLSVINSSSGRSGSTDNKWPNFIRPGTYDSGFGLRLMLKDMRIAVDLARRTGLRSRLGEDAVRLWSEAAESLEAAADHTEIARYLRETVAERARTER